MAGEIYKDAIKGIEVLKMEVPTLKEKLAHLVIDNELYNMPKDCAFIAMYNLLNPEEEELDNDYRYDISPVSLSDNNCFIFAVSDGESIRIMADELEYVREESRHNFDRLDIVEVYITVEELKSLNFDLKKFITEENR